MSEFHLDPHATYPGVTGPLVLVILDGVGSFLGTRDGYEFNAVWNANTPVLDRLAAEEKIVTHLAAHGTAVGMPSDADQGNSEVGHNALGAGRVVAQGAKLVNMAVQGPLFEGKVWQSIVERTTSRGSALHLIGLVSDGNVHSHIRHPESLIEHAAKGGIQTLYVHGLADGRDVDKRSAENYFERLEKALKDQRDQGLRYHTASGGGRMRVTMDRYEADWSVVERGWNAHVHGRCEEGLFSSAVEAVLALRKKHDLDDQNLPAWVIEDPENPGEPVGAMQDGDAVVFFNFRGDRAVEISRAFEAEDFSHFERGPRPDVLYAGMTQYDGDAGIPRTFLVEPPAIDRTLSEYLAHNRVVQFAASETQKFGHVTYFWHGNNSGTYVDRAGEIVRTQEPRDDDEILETQVKLPSDRVDSFAEAPEMKAAEVARATVEAIRGGRHGFIRVNFANGDMVGHTGDLPATVTAVEAVDQGLGEILSAVDAAGGTLIVTADHGNAEQMVKWDREKRRIKEEDGIPVVLVSHTLNPVPLIIHGPDTHRYSLNLHTERLGLGNMAATVLNLLGFEAPADYLPPIIRVK